MGLARLFHLFSRWACCAWYGCASKVFLTLIGIDVIATMDNILKKIEPEIAVYLSITISRNDGNEVDCRKISDPELEATLQGMSSLTSLLLLL